MNYKKLTVQELKNICKKNDIKGYSLLNKENLIKHIKKNLKKKMRGGSQRITNEGKIEFILDRPKLLEILKIDEKSLILKEEIDLSYEKIQITEIEKDTFTGLINLKKLNLSNNSIIRLADNTFKDLGELTELNLSINSINGLSKSEFTGLKNLKILDLSNNFIEEIPNNVFTHIKNIENINLSNNKINIITNRAFYNLTKLNHLDLTKNLVSDKYQYIAEFLSNRVKVCYTKFEVNNRNKNAYIGVHKQLKTYGDVCR